MNPNELSALISLLDDDDKEVYRHVHEKLLSMGPQVIPTLEQAWGSELNATTHKRLEEIIQQIQFTTLLRDFENWCAHDNPDLLQGAFLVARYHYPEIQLDDIRRKMLRIRQNIWLELNFNQTPLEQIQIFNQVFYYHEAFKGNQSQDYNDFCINHSLESRKGNTLSLGIIYQAIANDLNLPVYGVALPRHFILAFCKKSIFDFNDLSILEREVMFYINPINKGSVFSRNEIKDYLKKMGLEHKPHYFAPCGSKGIIAELIRQLRDGYQFQKEEQRAAEMKELLRVLKGI